MDRQAIAVGDLWQPGLLFVGRRAISLHLGQQIGPVILVADFDHVRVGNVAPCVIIVESRRNQKAHRLLDLTRDRFAFLPRDGFRSERVKDDDSFISCDEAAVKTGGREDVITRYQLS
jgi:hypothetical protein